MLWGRAIFMFWGEVCISLCRFLQCKFLTSESSREVHGHVFPFLFGRWPHAFLVPQNGDEVKVGHRARVVHY